MCRDRQELPLGEDEIGMKEGRRYGVPLGSIEPNYMEESTGTASPVIGSGLERVVDGGGPDTREYTEGDMQAGYGLSGSGSGWITGWGWNNE